MKKLIQMKKEKPADIIRLSDARVEPFDAQVQDIPYVYTPYTVSKSGQKHQPKTCLGPPINIIWISWCDS